MKKLKRNSGITLVALIITIIILLILAAVTIMSITGDGIISKSRQAKEEYEKSKQEEEGLLSQYLSKIDEISEESSSGGGNSGDNGSTEDNPENNRIGSKISKIEAYVGYYADIDADGTVDGVIYADLAIGNTGDGQWGDSNGTYTINKIDNTKDYYISQINYSGAFGTKDVLSSTGDGNDRFYVMALTDIAAHRNAAVYCWYYNSTLGSYTNITSSEFGTGMQNTKTMIEKWNNKAYGNHYAEGRYKDMWGEIQTQVASGWFVPSKCEWSAFAEELGITEENFVDVGCVSNCYWSSTHYGGRRAWSVRFSQGSMYNGYVYDDDSTYHNCVRLSAIF